MAGFTTPFARTTLDAAIVNGDKLKWSEDGLTDTTHVAPTAVAAWDASTDADPCLRKNSAALVSAVSDADVRITHFSVWDSALAVQKTDRQALDTPRDLVAGDPIYVGAQTIAVSLT